MTPDEKCPYCGYELPYEWGNYDRMLKPIDGYIRFYNGGRPIERGRRNGGCPICKAEWDRITGAQLSPPAQNEGAK